MTLYGFDTWSARDQDSSLREAWLASERFKADCDWSRVPGTCGLCGSSKGFALAADADRAQPNVRESLLCLSCKHSARIRASLRLLLDHLSQGQSKPNMSGEPLRGLGARLQHWLGWNRGGATLPTVYVTEQMTPAFLWLQRHLRADLHGSEFQPDPDKLHALSQSFRSAGGIGDVSFQDVTQLSFEDASLDAITSFDVLEHVPDYSKAIAEFGRTLRPGGVCVATFPFTDGPSTVVRAKMDEQGAVTHLLEPEYHGDPIGDGVLCFYHFGWDVLDNFRAAGFRSVRMVMPWNHDQGCLYGLWSLMAIR
ncbi:class I SAM-dependent methyltransferase [Lysobacter sp. CCNWLW3]|uniref:class I SAM-dependent methyltransferase n=1 Tax=unclassified Lysobacter TaxID=2635362 RepID=UPI002FCF9BA1